MTLCEDPRMRYMCPVTWFLSLAFADGAFKELESFNDLATVQPIPGNLLYRAKYKTEALEHPVMRGTVSVRATPGVAQRPITINSTHTSTRNYSTAMPPINDALAAIEALDPREKLVYQKIADQ
jgi:hypothetical protein